LPVAKASRQRSASTVAPCSRLPRAGYDGVKRRKGSKVHIAVDTLGHLLALQVTSANEGDRAQVETLAEDMQAVTGGTVELADVDQGYTWPNAAEAAQKHGIALEVVKHPLAKRGFVLLPRRWVVELSFDGLPASHDSARDYERLDTTLKEFPCLSFATLMIANIFKQLACTS
jgi:transposase